MSLNFPMLIVTGFSDAWKNVTGQVCVNSLISIYKCQVLVQNCKSALPPSSNERRLATKTTVNFLVTTMPGNTSETISSLECGKEMLIKHHPVTPGQCPVGEKL